MMSLIVDPSNKKGRVYGQECKEKLCVYQVVEVPLLLQLKRRKKRKWKEKHKKK
jgi:hypothetical protein